MQSMYQLQDYCDLAANKILLPRTKKCLAHLIFRTLSTKQHSFFYLSLMFSFVFKRAVVKHSGSEQ